MEKQDYAVCPRPVHHRIPSFKDAEVAAKALTKTALFRSASDIAVGDDRALATIREHVLRYNKTLYVPRLHPSTSYAVKLKKQTQKKQPLKEAVSLNGIKSADVIKLKDKFHVDLMVVGSVAVSVRGVHVGTGDGKSDLEVAVLHSMGAIDADTRIIAVVHDAQVMPLPFRLRAEHDIGVDMIVTPTRIIMTSSECRKRRILWNQLNRQKLKQYPLLEILKKRVETKSRTKLKLGPERQLPPRPFYPFGRKHAWNRNGSRREATTDRAKKTFRRWPFKRPSPSETPQHHPKRRPPNRKSPRSSS